MPALAYDRAGYRLGYGAGYYDRFLSNYPGTKVGIIYAQNLRKRLWSGRYDIPVDLILTERRLYARYPHRKKNREMAARYQFGTAISGSRALCIVTII